MAEESTGAFLSEEEVLEFKEACLREGIFFNEETGKVTVMRVYSENVTPENLREAVELYKKYKNGDLHNEERRDETEGSLTAGVRERVRGDDKEETREGGNGRPSEASPEPERPAGESESSERDEYLKPRNDKEKPPRPTRRLLRLTESVGM